MTAFASDSRNVLFARASASRAAIFRIIVHTAATIRVFAFIVSICHLSNSFQDFLNLRKPTDVNQDFCDKGEVKLFITQTFNMKKSHTVGII